MKALIRIACAVLALGWLTTPAFASTYYTATSGNDSRTCTQSQAITTPRATITAGIACLSAGDALLVRGGTYDEALGSIFPSGTSWSNTVRIANYPGETVWVHPTVQGHTIGGSIIVVAAGFYIEFDGINVDSSNVFNGGIIWIGNSGATSQEDVNHIRFRNLTVYAGVGNVGGSADINVNSGNNEFVNLTVHGGGISGLCGFACASYGIYLAGSNNLIDSSDLYDTSGAGVQIYCKVGSHANCEGRTPDGNIVRNTKIHDITRTGSLDEVWGIVVIGSSTQLFNNAIYGISIGNVNPGNAGIAVAGAGNKVWNNTIYGNTNGGIRVDVSATSTDVRNNIAYLSAGANYSNAGTGTVQDHNLFGVNPLFVNAAAANFQIQAGSPAIDAGATISTVTTDMAGVPRPNGSAYDIGAYEFHGSAPPSAPTGRHRVLRQVHGQYPRADPRPPERQGDRHQSRNVGNTPFIWRSRPAC